MHVFFFALFCILFLDKLSAICVRKKCVWGEGNPCVREPSGCPREAAIRLPFPDAEGARGTRRVQRRAVGAGGAPIGSFSGHLCFPGAAPAMSLPCCPAPSFSLPLGWSGLCLRASFSKSSPSSLSVLGINNPNFPAFTKR